MHNDRRRFNRVCFESPVRIKFAGHCYESSVIDLSLRGVLMHRPQEFTASAGDTVEVEIILSSETSITMDCDIVYSNEEKVGLSCNNIDIDSISHLKRLVELNTINAEELLERSLENLIN